MDEKITLAIESSCDETSAAILRGGRQVLSNIISTQIPIHQKFGGVVPEIASRKHIVNIMPVIDEALAKAGVELADIDQIAVTYGPGLVGALLVGVSAAKALAFTLVVCLSYSWMAIPLHLIKPLWFVRDKGSRWLVRSRV